MTQGITKTIFVVLFYIVSCGGGSSEESEGKSWDIEEELDSEIELALTEAGIEEQQTETMKEEDKRINKYQKYIKDRLKHQASKNNFDKFSKFRNDLKETKNKLCSSSTDKQLKFKKEIFTMRKKIKTKKDFLPLKEFIKGKKAHMKEMKHEKLKCFEKNQQQIGKLFVEGKLLHEYCFVGKRHHRKKGYFKKHQKRDDMGKNWDRIKKHMTGRKDYRKDRWFEQLEEKLKSTECTHYLKSKGY